MCFVARPPLLPPASLPPFSLIPHLLPSSIHPASSVCSSVRGRPLSSWNTGWVLAEVVVVVVVVVRFSLFAAAASSGFSLLVVLSRRRRHFEPICAGIDRGKCGKMIISWWLIWNYSSTGGNLWKKDFKKKRERTRFRPREKVRWKKKKKENTLSTKK